MVTDPWRRAVLEADRHVSDADVDAARRALDSLCLAQIYLDGNELLTHPLQPTDIVARPAGHWGTCPPANAVLAALGPYTQHLPAIETLVVHGSGHSGASARAHAWLTGRLNPSPSAGRPAARDIVRGFSGHDRRGGEITPLIPGAFYMGGQLGPALPVAQGMALDSPSRLVIVLIGDGECETGATASAWLGGRALVGTGQHGRVLPVILLNGMRMGGPSLLSTLPQPDLARFLAGLGYQAFITTDAATSSVRDCLRHALAGLRPLHDGPSAVAVVTIPKGLGAPQAVAGRPIAGTPAVHKTPLARPRENPAEFAALSAWLASYRPRELFTADAAPTRSVDRALGTGGDPAPAAMTCPTGCLSAAATVARTVRRRGCDFGAAISSVLADLHQTTGLRVFSPDELTSNRICLADSGDRPGWVVEVLSEELCHLWAQGYLETGRRAVVAGYEAFAPVAASVLAQHLTYRRLAATAGRPPQPSIVYLLTSLGWNNTISHANPSLVDMAAGCADQSVRVYVPADAARAAAALVFAVHTPGQCSLIIASKQPIPSHPLSTIESEFHDGCAIWPHVADHDHPELVLLSAGDIPARQLTAAARALQAARPGIALRYVHVHELTCLGSPGIRATAMPGPVFTELFPPDVPVLAAVTCHPAPVWALLAERGAASRFTVRGWSPPSRPLSPRQLLSHAAIDVQSLTRAAIALVNSSRQTRGLNGADHAILANHSSDRS